MSCPISAFPSPVLTCSVGTHPHKHTAVCTMPRAPMYHILGVLSARPCLATEAKGPGPKTSASACENQDRALGVLPTLEVGPRAVPGLGWSSQPTSWPPSTSLPLLLPGAGAPPAWPLSLMWSQWAHATNTPIGVSPDTRVRLGQSRTHTRTHTHVNTAAFFSSPKNSEPSKAGPPGVRQVCFLGV